MSSAKTDRRPPKPATIPLPTDPRLLILPLLALPFLTLLWWNVSAVNPGVQPARGAGPLLALLALLLVFKPPRFGWSLRSPWPWLAAALVWQIVGWFGWADPEAREPGLIWMGERIAAFMGALGTAGWLAAKTDLPEEALAEHRRRCAQAVMAVGGLVMTVAGISQLPLANGPFGVVTKIGADAPFGNPNFNTGGAEPLLGAGWAWLIANRKTPWAAVLSGLGIAIAGFFGYHELHNVSNGGATALVLLAVTGVLLVLQPWRLLPWYIWLPVFSGTLGMVCVGTKVPWHPDQATMAVWVGVVAMGSTALILRLPKPLHGVLLGFGAICAGTIWALLIAGDVHLKAGHAPSSGQRLELWRASLEGFAANPLLGSGPASAITTVNRQDPAAESWLWVPGYAEHSHSEYLEWLVDGGAPLAVLLLIGAALIAIPLWKRRDDLACSVLVTAWVGVAAHGLVESHLSQVGPMFLLALLAGMTWAAVPPTGGALLGPHATTLPLRFAGLIATCLILAQCVRDFSIGPWFARTFGIRGETARTLEYALDGGTPTMIAARCDARLEILKNDPAACAAEMELRTRRLGPEDVNLTRIAFYHLRANTIEPAERALRRQLLRLPTDGDALLLLYGIGQRYHQQGKTAKAEELTTFLRERAERARLAMTRIPRTDKGGHYRQQAEKAVGLILGREAVPEWEGTPPKLVVRSLEPVIPVEAPTDGEADQVRELRGESVTRP